MFFRTSHKETKRDSKVVVVKLPMFAKLKLVLLSASITFIVTIGMQGYIGWNFYKHHEILMDREVITIERKSHKQVAKNDPTIIASNTNYINESKVPAVNIPPKANDYRKHATNEEVADLFNSLTEGKKGKIPFYTKDGKWVYKD